MRREIYILFFIAIVASLFVFAQFKDASTQTPKASNPADAGCLKCHEGIERISDTPVMSSLACVQCHMANPDGATKEEAHKGMYANPTDLRVVDKTCGGCHSEHIENSKKSLHATSAGKISGTRYTNAAQNTKNAIYGNYDVEDKDGNIPEKKGALKSLKQLPLYDPKKPLSNTNHLVDDYLREQCLRCHIWSSGHERDGDWRASGCAACHVVYNNSGTYEGADKAIDKKQKGRPIVHKITNKIPESQCIHCHNRGGRTGVSFIGTIESDDYGSPWTADGKKQPTKHGKLYNHLTADIHYTKGMTCIDCHTSKELHGDGNIYSKKHQAVEIRCEDCHGTAKAQSSLKTSWGNPITNLKKDGNKIILKSKITEKNHVIPQTKDAMTKGSLMSQSAKSIPAHMNRLECFACHAKWASQCYGCHAKQDLSKPSGDWLNTTKPEDLSKASKRANREKTAFAWDETRSYVRWENPVLGINQKDKVSPFVPGCQAIFTQIGADGKTIMNNKIFTTHDGFSGIAHNPIQPHTITKEARSCEDCHSNKKTVGLGGGIYNSKANGLDLLFELERIVDENGKQLQATSHYGARPFNKKELDKILRVNVCVSCHDYEKDAAIWKKVTDVTGFAKTDSRHKEILKKIFEKGTK